MHSESSQRPAVAIVGIGGIFPQAPTLEQFWSIIRDGVATASQPPKGRWQLPVDEAYHPEEGKTDCVYSKKACFVDNFTLDLPFDRLNIDENLVRQLDPLFQLLLQAGVTAWQDANPTNIDKQRMGVIVGNLALPSETASKLAQDYVGRTIYEQLFDQQLETSTSPLNRYMTGLPAAVLGKALGLGGTCFTLDAACASSLYAIKLAVAELQSGRADAMLTGGVARPDSQYTQMGFSQLHALSPTGVCAPFDQSGNGLVVGEGAGVLLLKRTEDALRDGDHIYAQIAGIGLSNDIGGSLLAPMSEGQLRAMRAAYRQAGWQPQDVDHIECHATGTPVGDAVEFASLKQLWQDRTTDHRCVIGSVKSNIGHLLTAAGSAAVIKTLLALKHEQLPPTAGFHQAGEQMGMEDSPFDVLPTCRPWQRSETRPRRAAVSAFGFGGINAHLLLEEWTGNACPQTPAQPQHATEPIAIVGLDVRLADHADSAAFRRDWLSDQTEAPFSSPHHWYGAETSHWFKKEFSQQNSGSGHYLDQVAVQPGTFRIPPTELKEMLPRQALMLKSAAAALADAGLKDHDHLTTGVFVGTGLDLNATSFSLRWGLPERVRRWAEQSGSDLDQQQLEQWCDTLRDAICPPLTANRTMGALGSVVASRIAREFKCGGSSFTVAAEENSAVQALQLATEALRRNDVKLAIVGGVDLPGDIRAQLSAGRLAGYTPINEGACSVVLMPLSEARQQGHTIYAQIHDINIASAADDSLTTPRPEAMSQLADVNNTAYVDHIAPNASALGLLRRKMNSARPVSTSERYGHSGEAAGLVGVIAAALSLHHRILPTAADSAARYWLHNRHDGPRRALVTSTATGGLLAAVRLVEEERGEAPLPGRLPAGPLSRALFAVYGSTPGHLLSKLTELDQWLNQQNQTAIHTMATQWRRSSQPDNTPGLALTLVCAHVAELNEQIAFAREHLTHHPEQRLDGRGGALLPARARDNVFYNPTPLSDNGQVAFIFPGSGNHFPHMGRELGLLWPEIFEQQHRDNQRLKDQFQPQLFWNGSDRAQIEEDHNGMIIAHVALCTALSDLVRRFGVSPQAAIGYSLGESSSLFSLKAWQQRDAMLERIEASPLFTRDLGGPCDSARQLWQLPDSDDVDWTLGIVPVAAQQVEQALQNRERVYLLIINTPQECVIGGQRADVEALVAELGCPFIELKGVTTVHCPVPTMVAKPYHDLHLFPTTPPEGIRFYSCASGQPYTPDTESCAAAILAQAVDRIDFVRVIENAYNDGVRLFIETGSGNSCSRMIPRILGERPHMVRPVHVDNQPMAVTVTRLMAQLIAEGVGCDQTLLEQDEIGVAHPTAKTVNAVILTNGLAKPALPPCPVEQQNSYDVPSSPAPAAVAPQPTPSTSAAQIQPISDPLFATMNRTQHHHAASHDTFLGVSEQIQQLMQRNLELQKQLRAHLPAEVQPVAPPQPVPTAPPVAKPQQAVAFDRDKCMEFAIGSIAAMLGPRFAPIDDHPTRVRLPDEPLMLVDRIIKVEGEPCSMSHGRVITEHDVTADRWYLDGERIPTCVAVEAGQADLFLSGYLGIDFHTKGHAVYRLLDAIVEFHGELPQPGDVIRYDIRIERFFRQGDTWLFRFEFDSTVNGQPLMTMRNGCAGFFSQQELDAGKGIVHTKFDLMAQQGKRPADWQDLVPMTHESYTADQVAALRRGDLVSCFGEAFAALAVHKPYTLPSGHLELVDRVTEIIPGGGRFGLGQIRAEMDIQPEDWFLTCHFCDDNVMPGTLMYECCLHTLRIYLMRMGWVTAENEAVWQPVPGVGSQLKCRGQVTEHTRTVTYEVTLKELGYRPEPYAIVDALMYADGKPIVEIINMSVRLSGISRDAIQQRWQAAPQVEKTVIKPAIYDYDSILAYSNGNPSEAFGEPYKVFDQQRRIARLPRPPFQFLDRVTGVHAEAWKMEAGGTIEAQYDVPGDAWYFGEERTGQMPFSVLLEIALQPCGWMAAYVGSALTSDSDLCFRNLDGNAVQHRQVTPQTGTLTTTVKLTRVSSSGGMIIQSYDFSVEDRHGAVYTGDTVFGFFTEQALANQIGIRDAALYQPTAEEQQRAVSLPYPHPAPFPDEQLRMIDDIALFVADGGPQQLGYIRGTKKVDPAEWFFQAHFYQDPVCPGSLGLESFQQLLKYVADQRWKCDEHTVFEPITLNHNHHWMYRGQIIPTNTIVTVEAVITAVDDTRKTLTADGFLQVDGKVIYQMKSFSLRVI
nr:beta-ketoacyl synthase N-terminal-like domain-containing protein [uncultured Desulfuromonas sp.]